jgi:hypothetical protein
MEGTPEAVDRQRLEEELRRLEAELAVRESDAGGELGDTDQHQADAGTEMFDREWALGRIEDLRARLDPARAAEAGSGRVVRPGVVMPPADPDDDTTPLDEEEPPPPDLASIPMAADPDGGTTEDLHAPGELYHDGQTVPDVGQHEADDDLIEGSYRPD